MTFERPRRRRTHPQSGAPQTDAAQTDAAQTGAPPAHPPTTALPARHDSAAHLADVAHEIRSPTAIALGLVERLTQNQGLLPDSRRDIDRIAANLRVIDTHVRSLLGAARIETLDDRPTTVQELATCFRKTAQDFAPLADEEGVRLAVEAPMRLEAAVAPGHLTIVLSNLLVNAIRSTPRDGIVRCKLTLDRGLQISVADSGPGIPRIDRHRVLERFSSPESPVAQGDRTTNLGLGLEIVQRIAGAYDGWIQIGDAPEGGALVTVTLPERRPAGFADAARRDSSPAILRMANDPATFATAHGPPLVAVIADDDERGRALVDTLTHDETREVVRIERDDVTLGCGPPDAIVLAPDHLTDAAQLVQHAREHADHPDVPIIALAPLRDVARRLELLRLGVDDVIDPELSPEELRGRVDRQISRCRRDAQRRTDAARFRRAFHDAATGMGIATVSGSWKEVNPALCAITGFTKAQLLQRRLDDLDHPDDRGGERGPLEELLAGRTRGFQIDKRWQTADGAAIWVRISLSAERDGQGVASGLVVQVEDVTDLRTREGRLEHLAGHDGLTGLLGRRGFGLELRRRIVLARDGPNGALVVLDLDDLRGLNAQYGRHAGDHALHHVGWVLQDVLRRTDVVARAIHGEQRSPALVARIGGDQFAVLFDARTRNAVDAAAQMLAAAIRDRPLRVDGAVVGLSACYGSVIVDGTLPADQIVRDAIDDARGKKPGLREKPNPDPRWTRPRGSDRLSR